MSNKFINNVINIAFSSFDSGLKWLYKSFHHLIFYEVYRNASVVVSGLKKVVITV